MCVGTGEVLRDDRSTGNKGREGTNYKCVGDAGVMATLCKDGGRQTRRGKTRSLTYLTYHIRASQGFGCWLRNGWWWSKGRRPQSSAFFAMADEPVTRNT